MPQFSPGEAKTATAPITAKPAGMSCEAELFLGPDDLTKIASSGRVPFVSTGATKNVSLPITMPTAQGTLKGYIDVFAEGLRFLAYKTTEDVQIMLPAVAKFVYVSAIRHYKQGVNVDPGMGGGQTRYEVFEVDVQNQGGIAALCSAIASISGYLGGGKYSDWGPFYYEQYARNNALALKVDSAYINPGQIVTFREATWYFAYEEANWIQVKFTGDAGEIISEVIHVIGGVIH